MKEKFPAMVPIDYPTVLEPAASTSITYEHAYSWEAALARQLQEEEELSMMIVSRHRAYRDTFRETAWLVALQRSIEEEQEANASSSASTEGNNTPTNSSTFTTLQLPRVLESFECGVCAEVHNVAVKISLPICGHMFCKECLTTYTKAKIDDGRYPIFCPECVAERPRAIKTQLSEDVIQQLQLQLVLHCITLQCPRCKEVMNVDRGQFAQESVLVCPLPRCGHKWCKSCLKTLANSQQHHRCKNSNIDRLMKRKGWKYCPGCRTPVQKETGCNHMTCGTPGCNV
ncbi:hypothetical protein BJ912DRAFT_943999 [Pholiota molesta]|nr:hypothetical protein BJ912DRAFT_943999 [Pholiota molesta]